MSFRFGLLVVAVAGLSACGQQPSKDCSPSNCSGCCDTAGECQLPSVEHCGGNGGLCIACIGSQTCTFGVCISTGTGGGATGGGGGAVGGG
ncbi:MAG: hypothetical protein AB1938_29395, partial [Myxococcota bacterium]